jgi:UDP-N-acetylmuramate dehydrogenase
VPVLPILQANQPLREFSTFGIGGNARLFAQASSIEEMQLLLSHCKAEKIPFFILGKGSNCLFDDRGLDGLVILNKIAHLHIEDQVVDVGAGFSFSLLGIKTAKKDLAGLEFASGIPATVGGAIFMNAGANGGETSTYLAQVTFVDDEGRLQLFEKKELEFRYRYSSFHHKKGAIVSAKFILPTSLEARKAQLDIIDYRKKTQPLQQPSVGCVFKNPINASAGRLIEQAGLKGLSVGGAEVSPVHANFIVNKGNARAQDVLQLASLVQEKIKKLTGIVLEMEIRCIPYTLPL